MAEYYPLISRAVAGLRAGKPEARRAIYDRARQALIGQLRAMDPPVPEDAIARETAALDDAIARTEADIAGTTAPTAAGAAVPPAAAPDSGLKPTRPALDQGTKPIRQAPGAAPSLGGAKRDEQSRAEPQLPPRPQPPQPLPWSPAQPRTAARAPNGEPSPARLQPEPANVAPGDGEPAEVPFARQNVPPPLPAAPVLRVEPVDSGTDELTEADNHDNPVEEGRGEAHADRAKDGGARPAAPRPRDERRSSLRVWIVAVAALAAVVAIAVTAWRLRDNPQELTRTAVTAPAPTAPDKIVERADNSAEATPDAASAPVATDEAARTSKDAAPAPTTAQTGGATPQATTAPGAAGSASTDALLPIAYKAAILIDAPDTPEKVKTYVGTVVWHAQNVATGQGQPISLAIQADVSIPEANTQLSMQIRRNTEPQLPASHTIDLKFTIGAGSAIGSIKQVSVPQMRQQDMPTGDPLAGIPVTIADNYFLIGLMRGAAEERNLDLLRSRPWIDIPLLLANGKASKITFEKGANGERIFNDVLNSWKNAPN